jgi:hypothetical protein
MKIVYWIRFQKYFVIIVILHHIKSYIKRTRWSFSSKSHRFSMHLIFHARYNMLIPNLIHMLLTTSCFLYISVLSSLSTFKHPYGTHYSLTFLFYERLSTIFQHQSRARYAASTSRWSTNLGAWTMSPMPSGLDAGTDPLDCTIYVPVRRGKLMPLCSLRTSVATSFTMISHHLARSDSLLVI